MDKKYKQKVKEFFRKEGFYLVLFLCLCLVATVITISYKISNKSITQKEVTRSTDNSNISSNSDDKSKITSEIPNAEKVDKDSTKTKVPATEKAKAVTANTEVKFNKPVDGMLLRGYTYPKPVRVDDKNQRTIRGIDIEAKVGTNVKSAAEGIIESIGNNGVEDGMAVVVIHANGIKTKYTNLDSEVSLKKGDKVTSETVIGKVGLSAKIYNKEDFGEHLNLQVLNSENQQVDPLKYFEYKSE